MNGKKAERENQFAPHFHSIFPYWTDICHSVDLFRIKISDQIFRSKLRSKIHKEKGEQSLCISGKERDVMRMTKFSNGQKRSQIRIGNDHNLKVGTFKLDLRTREKVKTGNRFEYVHRNSSVEKDIQLISKDPKRNRRWPDEMSRVRKFSKE